MDNKRLKDLEEAVSGLYAQAVRTNPKGDKGDSIKGDSVKGDDGLSAYKVWLSVGNKGSEQAFLKSLKGKPGDDGVTTTITKEVRVKPLKGDDGEDAAEIYDIKISPEYELIVSMNNGTLFNAGVLPRGAKGEAIEYTRNGGGGGAMLHAGDVGRLNIKTTATDADYMPVYRTGQLFRVSTDTVVDYVRANPDYTSNFLLMGG